MNDGRYRSQKIMVEGWVNGGGWIMVEGWADG
jgi:hypothetical protein